MEMDQIQIVLHYEQCTCLLVTLGIAAIGLINEALDEGDLQKTMAALQNPAAKLTDIDPSLAQHYYDILQEARREKAHVCITLQTHNNDTAHTKHCLCNCKKRKLFNTYFEPFSMLGHFHCFHTLISDSSYCLVFVSFSV